MHFPVMLQEPIYYFFLSASPVRPHTIKPRSLGHSSQNAAPLNLADELGFAALNDSSDSENVKPSQRAVSFGDVDNMLQEISIDESSCFTTPYQCVDAHCQTEVSKEIVIGRFIW